MWEPHPHESRREEVSLGLEGSDGRGQAPWAAEGHCHRSLPQWERAGAHRPDRRVRKVITGHRSLQAKPLTQLLGGQREARTPLSNLKLKSPSAQHDHAPLRRILGWLVLSPTRGFISRDPSVRHWTPAVEHARRHRSDRHGRRDHRFAVFRSVSGVANVSLLDPFIH